MKRKVDLNKGKMRRFDFDTIVQKAPRDHIAGCASVEKYSQRIENERQRINPQRESLART